MASTTGKSPFALGVADGAPFLLVIVPFSLLFGVVATEAGLSIAQTMGFSIVVIAGAAQFTAVSLIDDHAPVLIVLASSLAVNLRMAMYSASLTPHLGAAPLWKRALVAYFLVDQVYACAQARYDVNPWSLADKLAYFAGVVLPVCPLWYVFTYVGAVVGGAIPPELALDFAVPICFLAMIGPMLRTLPHMLAAGTAVVLALLLAGVPNVGLILAGLGGMIVGAEAERRLA